MQERRSHTAKPAESQPESHTVNHSESHTVNQSATFGARVKLLQCKLQCELHSESQCDNPLESTFEISSA